MKICRHHPIFRRFLTCSCELLWEVELGPLGLPAKLGVWGDTQLWTSCRNSSRYKFYHIFSVWSLTFFHCLHWMSLYFRISMEMWAWNLAPRSIFVCLKKEEKLVLKWILPLFNFVGIVTEQEISCLPDFSNDLFLYFISQYFSRTFRFRGPFYVVKQSLQF